MLSKSTIRRKAREMYGNRKCSFCSLPNKYILHLSYDLAENLVNKEENLLFVCQDHYNKLLVRKSFKTGKEPNEKIVYLPFKVKGVKKKYICKICGETCSFKKDLCSSCYHKGKRKLSDDDLVKINEMINDKTSKSAICRFFSISRPTLNMYLKKLNDINK